MEFGIVFDAGRQADAGYGPTRFALVSAAGISVEKPQLPAFGQDPQLPEETLQPAGGVNLPGFLHVGTLPKQTGNYIYRLSTGGQTWYDRLSVNLEGG
ncbi:hypothetical protein, partial [Parachitinimonas caeni]